MKERIVSGIQPSGEMHIGNYLGALKDFVELQSQYDCFFFIADLHSLTENYDPEQKRQQIMDTLVSFLAAGVDPKKSTIFIQSQVPAHTELAWIFSTLIEVGDLFRMTQFKDKTKSGHLEVFDDLKLTPLQMDLEKGKQETQELKSAQTERRLKGNVGLLNYPILQAADILLYRPAFVPVGHDQIQHLELTNTIVRKFNRKYGETFEEIRPYLKKPERIMSLTNPLSKMSKSDPNSMVGIFDDPETIRKKVKKAVSSTKGLYEIGITDTKSLMYKADKDSFSNPEFMGGINLFRLLVAFNHDAAEKILKSDSYNYSTVKEELTEALIKFFAPYRAKREELESDAKQLEKIMDDGAKKAQAIAIKTLKEVKEKIGLL